MNCHRHATGPPTAPEAGDTLNYRFVRQIGLKTPLLVFLIFPFLYYIIGYIFILFLSSVIYL